MFCLCTVLNDFEGKMFSMDVSEDISNIDKNEYKQQQKHRRNSTDPTIQNVSQNGIENGGGKQNDENGHSRNVSNVSMSNETFISHLLANADNDDDDDDDDESENEDDTTKGGHRRNESALSLSSKSMIDID